MAGRHFIMVIWRTVHVYQISTHGRAHLLSLSNLNQGRNCDLVLDNQAQKRDLVLLLIHRHRESIDINLPFSVHLHYYPMISPPNIDIFPSPLLM